MRVTTRIHELRSPIASRRAPVVLEPGHSEMMIASGVALLVLLGVVMVLNTSYFFAQEKYGDPYLFTRRHVGAAALGFFVLLVTRSTPTSLWRTLAYPLLLVSIGCLVAVLIPGVGVVRSGAQRWIALPGFTFQPSELAKVAVVLYLAHSLTKKGARVRELATGFLPHLVVVGACVGLILLEPDFGTSALIAAVLLLMLLAHGARLAHLVAASLAAFGLGAVAAMTSPYRMKRLLTFLDPGADPLGAGYQLNQSLYAFGAGGLTGVGLGAGKQKMFFLPEAHTDFVFAVIGEELGLIGTVAVVGVFAMIGVGGYRLIHRHPDPWAASLAFGLTSLLLLQAFVNMGVAVGMLPTKGLVLPFVSYGGSALFTSMAVAGILLAIAREAK